MSDSNTPAIFEVAHSCGHTESRDLSAKPAPHRDSFAEWLAKQTCTECWKATSRKTVTAEARAERQQKADDALADQEESQLPVLTGSDKQIKWALTVRYSLMRTAYSELVEEGGLSESEYDKQVLTLARRIERAGWWIDSRELGTSGLLELLADPGPDESVSENPY